MFVNTGHSKDFFKRIKLVKGVFSPKSSAINKQARHCNCGEIKSRWLEYTSELYTKNSYF